MAGRIAGVVKGEGRSREGDACIVALGFDGHASERWGYGVQGFHQGV